MNQLDVDPQLERRLHQAFDFMAAATPIDDAPWVQVRREVERPRRTGRGLVAAAAALLLLAGAVGVWRVADREAPAATADLQQRTPLSTAPPPIDPPTPVMPEGEEYPIERIGHGAMELSGVAGLLSLVDESSLRYWRTRDATVFTVRSIAFQSDEVVELSCVGQQLRAGASATCGATPSLLVRQHVGWSLWEQTDGQPGRGTWSWSSVPADTDFVQFRVGELVLWQRPTDGMAVFPAVSETNLGAVAVAYRADGAVLATVDDASDRESTRRAAAMFPELIDRSQLDDATFVTARDGVIREFAACLRSRGVVVESMGGNGGELVAQPEPDEDIEPAWQACIVATQIWLDDFVADRT
jgi:hypothetical protein